MAKPWLNLGKIEADKHIAAEFQESRRLGFTPARFLHTILTDMGDGSFRGMFREAVTPSNESSIEYYTFTDPTISKVAGTQVRQPIFVVTDDEVYDKLASFFLGPKMKSHGLRIPMTTSIHPDWQQTSLLLAKDNTEVQSHEARHGIDPHINGVRKSLDRSIGELFAYYTEHIRSDQQAWLALNKDVANSTYFENYVGVPTSVATGMAAQWQENIDKSIKAIISMREKHGDTEAQRMLVQCKTLDELITHN